LEDALQHGAYARRLVVEGHQKRNCRGHQIMAFQKNVPATRGNSGLSWLGESNITGSPGFQIPSLVYSVEFMG
jgi:hypothetical protein